MFTSIPLINWFFNVNYSDSQTAKNKDDSNTSHSSEKSPTEESNSVVQDEYKKAITNILDNFDNCSSSEKEIRLRKKKEKVCNNCKMFMSTADLTNPQDMTSSKDSFSEDGEEKEEGDEQTDEDATNENDSSDMYVDEKEAVYTIFLNKNILGYVVDADKIVDYVEIIKKNVLMKHDFRYHIRFYWEEVLPFDSSETRVLKVNLMTYDSHTLVRYAAIEDSIEVIRTNSIGLKR